MYWVVARGCEPRGFDDRRRARRVSSTPDPVTGLPGGALALAPFPLGVPFRGHLLITDRGNGRIVS